MGKKQKTKMEEHKINFLNGAIADAQELIRFIDAKTAIVVTIIGAYLVGIYSIVDKIVAHCDKFSSFFWIIFALLDLILVATIMITARIINPSNKPNKNIKLEGLEEPKIPYYLAPNEYQKDWKRFFINSKKYKLSEGYNEFCAKINDCSLDDLLKSLSFEFMKVSYIRNIKKDRFNLLVSFLILSSIMFFVVYITYSNEISTIELKITKNQ